MTGLKNKNFVPPALKLIPDPRKGKLLFEFNKSRVTLTLLEVHNKSIKMNTIKFDITEKKT